jgi:large subunit ribosomal protein L1
MGSSKIKTVDMSIEPGSEGHGEPTEKAAKKEKVKTTQGRSNAYKNVKGLVDRTKTLKLPKAIELLQKTSYSKFVGTVSVDALVRDEKLNIETTFPHATGKKNRVAIVTEELLESILKGTIDFDVLIATPQMMPKVARAAKVLGPKGLMPNPKNRTVTEDVEKRKKELEAGSMAIKTERKAPLIHVTIGKVNQSEKELIANVEHLIKMVGPRQIKKMTISATMSPGIKVDLSEYQAA